MAIYVRRAGGSAQVKSLYVQDSLNMARKVKKGFVRGADGTDKMFYSAAFPLFENGADGIPLVFNNGGRGEHQGSIINPGTPGGYARLKYASGGTGQGYGAAWYTRDKIDITSFTKLTVVYAANNGGPYYLHIRDVQMGGNLATLRLSSPGGYPNTAAMSSLDISGISGLRYPVLGLYDVAAGNAELRVFKWYLE